MPVAEYFVTLRCLLVSAALACVIAFPAAATQRTGACGDKFIAPAASSLALTSADDGSLISPANGTGPADGWAAASLPTSLPDVASLSGNPWTVCGTSDNNKAVVFKAPLLAVPSVPVLSQSAGGSLSARTYFVQVTYTNLTGETTVSAEATLAVGANNRLVVAGPASSGNGTGWNVYVGTLTNNKTKQNPSPLTLGVNFTEPLGGLISGTTPPSGNTASSAYILDGGQVLNRYLVGGTNYQTATLSSDGANYRVINASYETRQIAGATTAFPARYGFPGGPGYQTTQGDNGTAITSGATSGGLTVTLPSITNIATGWTVRFDRDASKDMTLNTNGTNGGSIAFPGGTTSSVLLAPFNREFILLQYDGAVFRVLDISPATSTLIGVSGELGHVPSNAQLKLAKGSPGSSILRDGFFSPGDGGLAKYNWATSNCAAADDGAQVQPTAVTGCWIADLTNARNTPQVWGAVGNGSADDTSKVQAAINALSAAGTPLYFDTTHKYLITSTLNVTSPIDIEGQFRYAGWAAQSADGSAAPACPWGLINNALAIDALIVSAPTATVRGLCIQMSPTDGTNPTSGIAMKFAPPSGKYQSGVTAEFNTIIRPYDGIAVGGVNDGTECCGKGTAADGNVFSRNTILSPAHEGISNGKNSAIASSAGNTYHDNTIICHSIAGSPSSTSIGFALYDGGIDYDGTNNGPEGCNIGFAIIPGAVSGSGQFTGGVFRGVFGDQSTVHDLLIQPTDPLATVGDVQSTNGWAATTTDRNSVLIDCNNGSCFNLTFVNFTAHGGGAAQSLPVFKIVSTNMTAAMPHPGLFDFSLVGSQLCGYVGTDPVAGASALDIDISSPFTGRFVISGNRFNTCPGTPLPVGINMTIVGKNTHDNNTNISITNNDFSAITQAGGTPIVYTPNNENVIITNNMGITEMTGSVADAATIALPTVSLPNFAITGSGSSVTNLAAGGKWNPNGEIKILTASAITFGTGGNICNAITSVPGSFIIGRWNVAGNCFNLK